MPNRNQSCEMLKIKPHNILHIYYVLAVSPYVKYVRYAYQQSSTTGVKMRSLTILKKLYLIIIIGNLMMIRGWRWGTPDETPEDVSDRAECGPLPTFLLGCWRSICTPFSVTRHRQMIPQVY